MQDLARNERERNVWQTEHALRGGVSTMEMKSQSELKWELKWKRASQLAGERERATERERGRHTHTLAMRERNDKQIQMHTQLLLRCRRRRRCPHLLPFSRLFLALLFPPHVLVFVVSRSNPRNVFKTNKTNYNQAKEKKKRSRRKIRGDIFEIFEFSCNLIRNILGGATEPVSYI